MPKTPDVQYERELRLAVVMYGGVSLAVYMNGATQELLNLVKATAPDPANETIARHTDDELKATSALVYRQIARLASSAVDQSGSAPNPLQPIRQRFVVDILSGTSAGGINAVFLAKALANGQSVDDLARLWQSEGDLGLLINDAESLSGIPNLPRNAKPKSLLNSQRMYQKLLDAFNGMDKGPARGPLVREVDLFVTATDLEGLPVRLQLGGGEVAEERKYRKSFHLSFSGRRNDFEKDDNPFLAFISRCTSSFPVAFEPMQFKEVTLLKALHPLPPASASAGGESKEIPDRWARHFDEYDATNQGLQNPQSRPFADGGYLDNKPFSYAIDAITGRGGGDSGRVERKLIYIEPDPERLSVRAAGEKRAEPPNVVENALAVIQLRSYETIREELLRLRDRNRLIDKIRAVVAGVDADFQALGDQSRDRLASVISRRDEFSERALDKVVQVFGAAYGGYHRLKVGQVTDDLSQIIAQNAGISTDSDEFRAIRLLLRAWRNERYAPNPAAQSAPVLGGVGPAPAASTLPLAPQESEFKLLTSFDLSFRIRRVSFVIEQINRYQALTPEDLAAELGQHPAICGGPTAAAIAIELPDELAQAFDRLRLGLAVAGRSLRLGRETLLSPEQDTRLPEIRLHEKDIKLAAAKIMAQPTALKQQEIVEKSIVGMAGEPLDVMLPGIQQAVQKRVAELSRRARKTCELLLKTDSKPGSANSVPTTADHVAELIGRHYYTWYELYDSMLFPIVYGSEVGEEIAPMEPVRISPLTGRDDAGRGVVDPKLMPSGVTVGHFGAFLDAKWRARDILIGRMNAAEKLIRMVLAGTSHDAPDVVEDYVHQVHEAILEEEYNRAGSVIREQLDAILNVSTPAARLEFVQKQGLPAEDLPPAKVVEWIARSAKVMGRVFREASERPTVKRVSAAVLYAGHILTGMLEVLLPRQWWGLVLRLWIPRLLVFALALIVLGALLVKEQVTSLGWTTLWIVTGFAALTLVLRGIIQKRWSWLVRVTTSLVALILIGLLTIGVLYATEALTALCQRAKALVPW
jgi:patatin-related protein